MGCFRQNDLCRFLSLFQISVSHFFRTGFKWLKLKLHFRWERDELLKIPHFSIRIVVADSEGVVLDIVFLDELTHLSIRAFHYRHHCIQFT